ncbi:MAG: hypothetical protein LBH14_03620, partial [Desulfobulbaceae bacterium]|nr:hypothetical protein [Desulfobulbaceae bacterium]
MDAIATVALVIFLLAAILAVVSLIKPGAAFFLKDKTRKKAFFSYLGIAFLGLVVIGIAAPKVEKKPEGAKSTNQQSSVGDKKEATVSGEQAAKAELRTLYLEFEGFIKSGDIQKESWLDTAKRRVWTERLEKICGGSLFTPDLKKSGCDIASNL